jgi:hypothetical protein
MYMLCFCLPIVHSQNLDDDYGRNTGLKKWWFI